MHNVVIHLLVSLSQGYFSLFKTLEVFSFMVQTTGTFILSYIF